METIFQNRTTFTPKTRGFIPIEILLDLTREGFDYNGFIHNLENPLTGDAFDPGDIWEIIKMYRLATVPIGYDCRISLGCVFPYIDERHRVRYLQVKQFDEANYCTANDSMPSIMEKKYKKSGEDPPAWLDEYGRAESKASCHFGTHLLKEYPDNPVAITNDPVSAIYGALYFGIPKSRHDLLWMATYSNLTLNRERCEVLRGRKVTLFPELSPGDEVVTIWRDKAKYLNANIRGASFAVSDLLQSSSPPDALQRGITTIMAFLTQFDWRDFRKGPDHEPPAAQQPLPPQQPKYEPLYYNEPPPIIEFEPAYVVPGAWDKEIAELDEFFRDRELPPGPLVLNPWTTAGNPPAFLRNNLETARANNGSPTFRSYLDMVVMLKEFIQSHE